MTREPQNLMPKRFWEDEYYGDPELPQAPSDDFPYERALSAALGKIASVAAGERVIEVGCAPARWLEEADFFDDSLDLPTSDLVLSLGFIEHFDDLERAFRRHLDLVAPGGRVAIGVPNFRGLTGVMQRWADPEFLAAHNRAAMDPQLFRGFARAAGWRLEAHRYLGIFDPWMIHVRRHGPGAILVPLMPIRRLRWTDRLNHPRISSYLLMTFTR